MGGGEQGQDRREMKRMRDRRVWTTEASPFCCRLLLPARTAACLDPGLHVSVRTSPKRTAGTKALRRPSGLFLVCVH